MSEAEMNTQPQAFKDEDIESALLEADLFLKYQVPHRALERLRRAVEKKPQSVILRERLREVALANQQPEEAARQCLALANLYIALDNFDSAQERLLEAKQADSRISIASGLEAIRRARRQDRQERQEQNQQNRARPDERIEEQRPLPTLAGDLTAVSIFDAVQVIENSRLTGALTVWAADDSSSNNSITGSGTSAETPKRWQRVFFNDGLIVGAEADGITGGDAFRRIVETSGGTFSFEKATTPFPVTINAISNTNLILDSLRQMDEEKM